MRAIALVLLLAPLAAAEDAPPGPVRFHTGELSIGLMGVDEDTGSSTLREYRVLPDGVTSPLLRLSGDGSLKYDFRATNVLRDDGQYRLRLEPGSADLVLSYGRIAHRTGNDARSLLTGDGGTLVAGAGVQASLQGRIDSQFTANPNGVNFAFLNGLVAPLLAGATPRDLETLRQQGRLDLRLARNKPFEIGRAHV